MELILGAQHIKLGKAHDISVPVQFGSGLAEFGAPPAEKHAYKAGDFTGNVHAGGSCNCDYITFSPHLHGTHTECVGHIVREAVAVHEVLQDAFIAAQLVSITPVKAASCNETYAPALRPDDLVITQSVIASKISDFARQSSKQKLDCFVADAPRNDDNTALIIRTAWKHGSTPAFFTIEAMEYIAQQGVQHLLVDMPSIDRLDDEGKLTNHHIFWGIAQGSHSLAGKPPSPKTVTELIFAPSVLPDGHYMLNLQVAAFASDATPSRPILYEIIK
ncbi:MAG: cyclase family protein [Alphaproteobacteria bacterium]